MFQAIFKKIYYLICFFYAASVFAATPDNDAAFLILTDIHFNPYASCALKRPCDLINALIVSPASQWEAILEKKQLSAPKYNFDTNMVLLSATLSAAGKVAAKHQVKFVFILGDFLGHEFKNQFKFYTKNYSKSAYRDFVSKTFTFLKLQIQKSFPNTEIITALGNNDAYLGNYIWKPNDQFYTDYLRTWSSLITNAKSRSEMGSSFTYNGYYALTPVSQPNLKVIVLNTNLFSNRIKANLNNQSAINQLNWLHQELQTAYVNQQKVYIIMHIPEGIDLYATLHLKLLRLIAFWQPSFSVRFQKELNQYASIIEGVFSGHLHSNWFQVLKYDQNEVPFTGTSSISPIFGNSPEFKLFFYSPETLALKGYLLYDYAINNYLWNLHLNPMQVYQSECRDCVFLRGFNFLKTIQDFTQQFIKSKWFSKDYAALNNWYPYQVCTIHRADSISLNCTKP